MPRASARPTSRSGERCGWRIESAPTRSAAADAEIESISDPGYSAWVFDGKGHRLTSTVSRGVHLSTVPDRAMALNVALRGSRAVDRWPIR